MPFCFPINYLVQRVGCFKDTSRRAIPQLDGKSILLRGSYRHRKFAIKKCALDAARRGYKFMGIQHGGWCASGPWAHRTFAKYGRSNRCRNGKGGPWANDVYRISGERFLERCAGFIFYTAWNAFGMSQPKPWNFKRVGHILLHKKTCF